MRKAKTRQKLAVRGLGPLVRPGRPGRGRRGALAPGRGAGVADAVAGSGSTETQPVCEASGYGEVLLPFTDSVRERVRLRPAVRDALDIEAQRLGMTREGLCRVVLEEVARNAVDGSAPGSASVVPDAEDALAIPAGYVGGANEEADDTPATVVDPVAAGGDGVAEAADEPVPGADPLLERAVLPLGRRSGGDVDAVRAVRRVRCLPRFGGRVRGRGAWGAVLAVALLGALSVAAVAVSSRYEVAGTAADGVYVVDRWRGAVWRCGVTGRGRPPACAQAVFRRSVAGADVAYLGRVSGQGAGGR